MGSTETLIELTYQGQLTTVVSAAAKLSIGQSFGSRRGDKVKKIVVPKPGFEDAQMRPP